MKALSIRQPWAWAVIHAGKDVENRRWPTRFRGRVLVHASQGMTPNDFGDAELAMAMLDVRCPPVGGMLRGGIIGSVEIVDCVRWCDSPWFGGPWGFVLRDPRPLPFYSCRGALRFFDATHPDMLES